MSFAQLNYFVAVAEEENLTRAAARLRISQPPLTRQIRSLEEELGVVLFCRSKAGMRLLPAGKLLLAEARAILGRVQALPTLFESTASFTSTLRSSPAPSPPRLEDNRRP